MSVFFFSETKYCSAPACVRARGLEEYFRCKFGNTFGTHFKKKTTTVLKCMHRDPCVFAKSGVSHYLL